MNLNSAIQGDELFRILKEDKVNKILVLNKNERDLSLIKNFLDGDFEVVNFNKEIDLIKVNYDLILIDEYYYSKYQEQLFELKEKENPIFLPVILLSSSDKNDIYLRENENIFDDLFILPVKKTDNEV